MTIMRASLPEEFYDITSAMLLKQPEPQYLHAQLVKMALAESLESDDSLGFAAGRQVGELGADYVEPLSDRLIMSDPIMVEAIHVVPELGKAPGQTVRMNRPKFTDSTYTEASRAIVGGAQISTTPIDLSSEQVAITIKRYGGPYDQTNTRVAPHAVDRFDAKMSIHSMAKLVGTHLKRDFDKWLDGVMIGMYEAASSSVFPAGFAADNDITVAGAAPMDVDTLFRAEAKLDNANIPTFANGQRVCVLSPDQLQQLKNDSQFARYVQFFAPQNPVLAKSYIGSVGKLDIYKSNTLGKHSNSSSVSVTYGQAFGPGAVGVGFGEMPRVAYSTADNYGEQAVVIWLLYAGFAMLDNRFAVLVKSG